MTGTKEIVKEMRPNVDQVTVSFGNNSNSKVMGLGKVVVAPDITLVDVMLVETLGYNLLSVRSLGKMGLFVTIWDDEVTLLWKKSHNVAFVGYVEHGLYVVDFSGKTATSAMCLYAKSDEGWLWHRRLGHANMKACKASTRVITFLD